MLEKQISRLKEESIFFRLLSGYLRFPRSFAATGLRDLDTLIRERFENRWLDNGSAYRIEQRLCKYLNAIHGNVVPHGIFRGMRFEPDEKAFLSSMRLGTFELQVQHLLQQVKNKPYDHIINVGCAEGYYAVGCAIIFPTARVQALDYMLHLQEATMTLAKMNGVDSKISTGGRFDFDDVSIAKVENSLLIIDIEGSESELLKNPSAFSRSDLIVEIHEGFKPGIHAALREAFQETHEIQILGLADFANLSVPIPDLSVFSSVEIGALLFCNRGVENRWGLFLAKDLT